MNILIPITYERTFIDALVDKIRRDINFKLLATDFRLLDMWIQVEFGFDSEITCRKIIQYALRFLECVKMSTQYKLQFNQTIYYSGTATRLITLLKTINYGTRHFKGIPIITEEFKQVNMNLDNLYNQYKLMGVVI